MRLFKAKNSNLYLLNSTGVEVFLGSAKSLSLNSLGTWDGAKLGKTFKIPVAKFGLESSSRFAPLKKWKFLDFVPNVEPVEEESSMPKIDSAKVERIRFNIWGNSEGRFFFFLQKKKKISQKTPSNKVFQPKPLFERLTLPAGFLFKPRLRQPFCYFLAHLPFSKRFILSGSPFVNHIKKFLEMRIE